MGIRFVHFWFHHSLVLLHHSFVIQIITTYCVQFPAFIQPCWRLRVMFCAPFAAVSLTLSISSEWEGMAAGTSVLFKSGDLGGGMWSCSGCCAICLPVLHCSYSRFCDLLTNLHIITPFRINLLISLWLSGLKIMILHLLNVKVMDLLVVDMALPFLSHTCVIMWCRYYCFEYPYHPHAIIDEISSIPSHLESQGLLKGGF